MTRMIDVAGLDKAFTLHTQGGITLPVFAGVDLAVEAGACVALSGASGSGKSTLLRALYGNYRADRGTIRVRHDGGWIDMVTAEPRLVLAVRRRTIGYVSQFLRAVPRVPAEEIVVEPLLRLGATHDEAIGRARTLLARLRIPERLWHLAPATFSGGEQQRVNIARGLIAAHPILLLDEPTAALDAANRATVIELMREAKANGAAIVGIFHDREVRDAVADRLFDMTAWRAAA